MLVKFTFLFRGILWWRQIVGRCKNCLRKINNSFKYLAISSPVFSSKDVVLWQNWMCTTSSVPGATLKKTNVGKVFWNVSITILMEFLPEQFFFFPFFSDFSFVDMKWCNALLHVHTNQVETKFNKSRQQQKKCRLVL